MNKQKIFEKLNEFINCIENFNKFYENVNDKEDNLEFLLPSYKDFENNQDLNNQNLNTQDLKTQNLNNQNLNTQNLQGTQYYNNYNFGAYEMNIPPQYLYYQTPQPPIMNYLNEPLLNSNQNIIYPEEPVYVSYNLQSKENNSLNVYTSPKNPEMTKESYFIKVTKDEYIEYYFSKINTLLPELKELCVNTEYYLYYEKIVLCFGEWLEQFTTRTGRLLTSKIGLFSSIMVFVFGISHSNIFLLAGTGGTIMSSLYLLWNKTLYNKEEETKKYKRLKKHLNNFNKILNN